MAFGDRFGREKNAIFGGQDFMFSLTALDQLFEPTALNQPL
jgi:hypothetical protein